jgi:hypothetical protein
MGVHSYYRTVQKMVKPRSSDLQAVAALSANPDIRIDCMSLRVLRGVRKWQAYPRSRPPRRLPSVDIQIVGLLVSEELRDRFNVVEIEGRRNCYAIFTRLVDLERVQ